MRFGIQDLLLLTTLAAVYCAGLMALPDNAPPGFSSYLISAPLLLIPIGPLRMARRRHRQLGFAKHRWRSKHWWVPHFAFASVFVVYVVWGVLYDMNAGPIMPMMSLTHHAMFFAWTPHAVGENGVLLGPSLLRWRDYRFAIDPEQQRLRFAWDGDHSRRSWTLPASGEAPLPLAALEAIAELIPVEQGAERQRR